MSDSAGLGRYLDARKLLRNSISSKAGAGSIGLALATGTLAALIAHIPGGALVDWAPWKWGLAAILALRRSAPRALFLALAPTFAFVFVAEFLHGTASGLLAPAIAAISLGLVGRGAMFKAATNYGFDAAGNALTAGAICIPALIALGCIRADGSTMYQLARRAWQRSFLHYSGFRPFCVGLRLPVISTSSEHEAILDERIHEFLQSLRLAVEQVIDRLAPLRLRHMGFNLISLQLDALRYIDYWAFPTVSAITAPRAPRGFSPRTVESRAVWCSISQFS